MATLPAALGGGKAELLVEISAAKPGQDDHLKAQIEFHPDQIKLAQGDSRTVNLMLSRSYDKDVTVGRLEKEFGFESIQQYHDRHRDAYARILAGDRPLPQLAAHGDRPQYRGPG